MKNVLVTGGAGYVGAVLVPQLLARGYRVTVLDLFLYGDVLAKHRNLKIIKGDIRDIRVIGEALRGIDSIIHLACVSNDPSFELDPKLGKSINYDATLALIDAAKQTGVARFIFASSSSVYGIKKEKNVTEDLPLAPLTDYSTYKVLCEEYLLKKQDTDFTTTVLRPATVCGISPRMRLDLTVNILTINALVNKKIIVHGGSQKRPNIHIKDMCRAYLVVLAAPIKKIAGKIFNVGYENYSIIELATMVKKVLRDDAVKIDIEPSDDLRSYHISSEKIKRELGFIPTHTVEDAIRDIKDAYAADLISSPDHERYYNIRMLQGQKSISSV